MIHLSYDQAVDELFKAVQARGERYVYPEDLRNDYGLCQYAANGKPACIVGQVFHQIGADVSTLVQQDASVANTAVMLGVDLDVDAAILLSVAQELQDEDVPWGEAVSNAVALVRPDVAV